jgi:hypothetical protein
MNNSDSTESFEKKLLRGLVKTLFYNNDRTDKILFEWFCNRSVGQDIGKKTANFMILLLGSTIRFNITSYGNCVHVVDFFSSSNLQLHSSQLLKGENSILSHVVKNWKLFFNYASNENKEGFESPLTLKCSHFDNFLSTIISADILCARFFSLLLFQARGAVPNDVPKSFLMLCQLFQQKIQWFKQRHSHVIISDVVSDVVSYGGFEIIQFKWNPHADFLPHIDKSMFI